jgi:hypothetical protein
MKIRCLARRQKKPKPYPGKMKEPEKKGDEEDQKGDTRSTLP